MVMGYLGNSILIDLISDTGIHSKDNGIDTKRDTKTGALKYIENVQ
jgi:hypothetical protein